MSYVIFRNTFSNFEHSKYENGEYILTVSEKDKQILKYLNWAPAWVSNDNLKFEPFKSFL